MREIRATLEAINSRRDRSGNCYWAFRFTDLESGQVVEGRICGGESNIYGIRCNLWTQTWDQSIQFSTTELPIREWNRLTKEWPYAGCTSEDLAEFIRIKLNSPNS
jgi:hypothetical protein